MIYAIISKPVEGSLMFHAFSVRVIVVPLLVVCAVFGASPLAKAQSAPPSELQTIAPVPLPPVKPSAKTLSLPLVPPAQPVVLTAREVVARANVYFNTTTTFTAEFVQLTTDGRRSEGELYVQKPGHMRFDYTEPATLQILADGTSVAVRDKKLHTQDLYFIAQTPLKFLLSGNIDITKDTKVLDVQSDADNVAILIEDKATLGGTSRIKLVFDPGTFTLKQWIVTDPQGYETVVSLFNIDTTSKIDPGMFKINLDTNSSANKK
jgi:outer membrane lipoprotein-sorting protein